PVRMKLLGPGWCTRATSSSTRASRSWAGSGPAGGARPEAPGAAGGPGGGGMGGGRGAALGRGLDLLLLGLVAEPDDEGPVGGVGDGEERRGALGGPQAIEERGEGVDGGGA